MDKDIYDALIIGAGAAGMMCASVAGGRGAKVLVIDHAKTAGEKIRISGGGRCNFTNIYSSHKNFISQNPHFCKSALAGYTPHDFLALVESYKIEWHEKTLGQLFCDDRSTLIVSMLKNECRKVGAKILIDTGVTKIKKSDDVFIIDTNKGQFKSRALVVACGGPSIPKMGATGFGYKIAEQFGLPVIEPIAALVPLVFTDSLKASLKILSGISVNAQIHHGSTMFEEALLFTHRGLSGPSILQISSYWNVGDTIRINLAPDVDILAELKAARMSNPKLSPAGFLSNYLPQKLAQFVAEISPEQRLADMSSASLLNLAGAVNDWQLKPAGSEGMRTAEVARGGVDTNALSSKTMECRKVSGLYFIGEVVDVTGHLGGHNFQWAWASGVACGNALI
ncbi:MAG: aminoacetone oxidase family FAD-binding enzyme [Robiginitomaculum sp.]|nr:MAG: aminoacetone oxidase family FAD-binding enzyme [Robiginitomaculum sp.]